MYTTCECLPLFNYSNNWYQNNFKYGNERIYKLFFKIANINNSELFLFLFNFYNEIAPQVTFYSTKLRYFLRSITCYLK